MLSVATYVSDGPAYDQGDNCTRASYVRVGSEHFWKLKAVPEGDRAGDVYQTDVTVFYFRFTEPSWN